jgi:hypothetical protein
MERYLRVNLLGPGPSSYTKIIYRAAVSQRSGNTVLEIYGSVFRVVYCAPDIVTVVMS